MKKKLLIVGAALAISVPVFAYADSDQNSNDLSELPKVTLGEKNLDNDKAVNESPSNESSAREFRQDESNQFRANCIGNGKGRGHGFRNNSNGRQMNYNKIVDVVERYAPEKLSDWKALIKKREEVHEKMMGDNQFKGRHHQMNGMHNSNNKRHMNQMHMYDNGDSSQGQFCNNLYDAISSGDEGKIKSELDEMYKHWQERNGQLEKELQNK